MHIDEEIAKYIKLQRTDFTNMSLHKVAESYEQDIKADYDSIKAFLPVGANDILDIGCGVGLINKHMYEHFDKPNLWLLDKTETDTTIRYGFRATPSFYNSLHVTNNVLMNNNIPEEKINLVRANDGFNIAITDVQMDVVTSFVSWGFHYPVQTYLPSVLALLAPNGKLILDLRHQEDIKLLQKHFKNAEVVCLKNKVTRVVCWEQI